MTEYNLPEPVGGRCVACQLTGLSHCSDPRNCGEIPWHYDAATMQDAYRAGRESMREETDSKIRSIEP